MLRVFEGGHAPFLIIALVIGVIVADLIVWVVSTGPRMKHQLAQYEIHASDGQVRQCMGEHGWRFNRGLMSCDNGSARDIGCHETGFGT
jgi:hypothetical protein